MNIRIPTNYEEFTLAVTVKSATGRPECIHITLKDNTMPNTVFTDRYKTIMDEFTFYVRMPVSGKSAELIIYNERTGNIPSKSDSTFEVVNISKQPLQKKMDVVDFNNPVIRSFINFSTRFCFNAGVLTSGEYVSDDGKFKINYTPTILSKRTNTEMNTPARISKTTGIIQIAQKKFVPMTIPMRMAILMHEFSHYYVNDDINNEIEADLNGLLIYLGLGYPRIEAYQAFLGTFVGTPTLENKKRADLIDRFIRDYEKNNLVFNG